MPSRSQRSFINPFEPSSAAAAAVGPNAAIPSASNASTRPANKRRLGADHDEIDRFLPAEGDKPGRVHHADRHAFDVLGDAGITRRAVDLVDQRRRRDRPDERVLAPARPDNEDAH